MIGIGTRTPCFGIIDDCYERFIEWVFAPCPIDIAAYGFFDDLCEMDLSVVLLREPLRPDPTPGDDGH